MSPTIVPFPVVAPEILELRDGRSVALRPITADARQLIADAVARMSAETSRRRFFTVRRHLSDPELDVLTAMDGIDRYALGAAARQADRCTEGVASARYVRIAPGANTAEAALVVLDDWQRVGLGSALLRRLGAYAFGRGIVRFTGAVLPESTPMIRLLLRLGAVVARVGDHLEFDLRLAPLLGHARAA
jgi:GNAT superfamily N-acetyltransferase